MNLKTILLLSLGIFLGGFTAFGQCQEPFFSEYIEGSSNNKGFEIYNPTGDNLDLSDYQVYLSVNGGVAVNVLTFTTILAPGDVYVVVTDEADSVMLSVADTAFSFPSVAHFNGDDALGLVKVSTGDTIDVIGVIGVDPGSNWPVDTGSTANHTLVRNADVHEGTSAWTGDGDTQWTVYPSNTFTFFGSHTKDACPFVSNCTTDLFFSEYIEGSSNNKGVEVYNPGDTAVDLSFYKVYESGNGGSFFNEFVMEGMLAPGDVYVIVTDQADSIMQSVADTALGFPSVVHHNGDDAFALVNLTTLDTIDVIGEIGIDPGTSWPVDTGSTQDHTLVRKPTVNEGVTDWALGATQWIVLPQNTYDSLGMHTMFPCSGAVDSPLVSISPASASITEGDDTVSFSVNIFNADTNILTVDVVLDSMASTATPGEDFMWMDTTLTFPANATDPIDLSVIIMEDSIGEQDETIVLNLVNVSTGGTIGSASYTLTIEDNDYIAYPIGLVTDDADGNGLGDSIGVRMQVQGIVHGIDLQGGNSVQFTMIDSTGGVTVFSGNDFGYVVTEGDEVIVQGTLTHFNGLTEFSPPDTIILVSQGNPLVTPVSVSTLDETTENELVTLECVTIIDTADWPTDVGSRNVDVTNGVDTFVVRIDSDTDIDSTAVPTGKWLNITGIGGQFDSSDPRTEGYQLLPRYLADIEERPDPTVEFGSEDATIREFDSVATTLDIVITNGNPDTTWVTIAVDTSSTATDSTDYIFADTTIYFVGCGTDTISLPVNIISDSVAEDNETLVFLITSVGGNDSTALDTVTYTITEWAVGIEDKLPANAIKLFPNPASQMISWESSYPIDRLEITNLVGQTMLRKLNPAQANRINIESLPNGVYIMRVHTQEGLWVQKWIKR